MQKHKKTKQIRILISDLDFTLNRENPAQILRIAERKGYGKYSKDTWKLFEESAKDMNSQPQSIPLVNFKSISGHYDLVFIISSRISSWRRWTKKWLNKWGFKHDKLFLRQDKDYEIPNAQIKKEIVTENILKKYDNPIVTAVDDDINVCAMYEALGFKVFRAPDGWKDAVTYHKRLARRK